MKPRETKLRIHHSAAPYGSTDYVIVVSIDDDGRTFIRRENQSPALAAQSIDLDCDEFVTLSIEVEE